MFGTQYHEYLFNGNEINDLPKIVYSMENPYFEPGVMLTYAAFKEAAKHSAYAIGGEAADQVFGCCASSAHLSHSIRNRVGAAFDIYLKAVEAVFRSKWLEGNYILRKVENRLTGHFNVNNWCGCYGFRDCDIKEILKQNFTFSDKYPLQDTPYDDLDTLFRYCCDRVNLDYALYGILAPYGKFADLLNMTCFSPYIDSDVLNYILSLENELRAPVINGSEHIFGSKYLQKELAGQIFPDEIIKRPKQGRQSALEFIC